MKLQNATPRTDHPARLKAFSGMTLIELLVVVAILGLLAVTVIPNISGILDRRRIRDAAGNLSAFASRAQSRALNAKEPRGLIVHPLASGVAAIDFYFADTPDAYAGETTLSTATITINTAEPAEGSVSFSDGDARMLADPGFCKQGDAIQFGGHGPYFHFSPPAAVGQSGVVRMWSEVNQSPLNMVLPVDGSYSFRVRRRPARASSGILQLGNGAAVDIFWSEWGGVTITQPTLPIIILYDAAGRPSHIMHSGGPPVTIVSPIYLLVGLVDLCGNGYVPMSAGASTASQDDRVGANWQYADSFWVLIDNKTGLARTAPCAARDANSWNGPVQEKCRVSQAAIRGAIGVSSVE